MTLKILLITFVMSFTFSASAREILASKEAPYKNYRKCFLSHGEGSLEIEDGRNKFIETSKISTSLNKILKLATPAIASAGNEYYRWFPVQTNYKVIGENAQLVTFYATGFLNINNQSFASKELISSIDSLCDEQLTDFRILGEFQINLTIGAELYRDKLILNRSSGFSGPRIEGSYIVPNSFESKIKNINYMSGKFSFIIHVQEGDDDYKARFEGFLDRNDKIEGKAVILPSEEPLGFFTGQRI